MRATLVAVVLGALAATAPPLTIETGIQQIRDGELDAAVLTLDEVIRRLESSQPPRSADLARAYMHKGIALVGLAQEEPAKAAFRAALAHEPSLRLAKDEFPPRVIRIFEAAREGKTKSVLEPPSTAPKKAGIGAAGIAAIAGGVALVGGGAAVAASGGAETAQATPTTAPTPTPTPMPTPTPAAPLVSLPSVFLDGGAVYGVSAPFEVRGSGTLDVTIREGLNPCQFMPDALRGLPSLTRLDLLREGSGAPVDSAGCRGRAPCASIDLVVPIVAGRYNLGVRRDAAFTQGHCFVSVTASFPGSGQ